jgi:oxalate---CoA ligase
VNAVVNALVQSPAPSDPSLSLGVGLSLHEQLHRALSGQHTPALFSGDRAEATGEQLLDMVREVSVTLNRMGIRRGTRVAYALPDSAETAVLALACMSVCTAVPVNPRMPVNEFTSALQRLHVDTVIVPADIESNGRRAAQDLKLRTLDVTQDPSDRAGAIRFIGQPSPDALVTQFEPEWTTAHDVAMVVQTSGTTGQSKIVPLTHQNILSMMLANCQVLALTPQDRCLGLMPLYHIHGLGALLCALLSRGSVFVSQGFKAADFFLQLRQFGPTWYTAVPTVHQSVLAHADEHKDLVADVARRRQLRFIRSGSAPMPRGVAQQLVKTFNTRYIEACGATECSAYICSNRYGEERIGSVGKPMPGNIVHVIDEQGLPVGPDVEGELVVQGPGVFGGYEGNPQLNANAFIEGFFRTGDLARTDDDGYVYLTGRLKEQINRAGLKVSPREVDDAIATHPGVLKVATFALPDPVVGEEVACAIVKRAGQERLSALDLQRFVADQLADYKVPRRVVFVDDIPTNAVGKICRVTLAEQLGLIAQPPTTTPTAGQAGPWNEPVSATQIAIATIWSRVLGRTIDNIDIDFYAAGGDSLQAMDLSLELEHRFSRLVPVAAISSNATIRTLARAIEDDGWRPTPGAPVVFQKSATKVPTLFCLPGVGGNVFCYAGVATRLADTRVPIVGLPLPGTDGLEAPLPSVDAIADRYLSHVRLFQPHGPYVIAGYSFGGRVGFEVCRRLIKAGESVRALVLIDTPGPDWPPPLPEFARWRLRLLRLIREPASQTIGRLMRLGRRKRRTPEAILKSLELQTASPERQRIQVALVNAVEQASADWTPERIDVPIVVLRAARPVWEHCDTRDPTMGWTPFSTRPVRVMPIQGSHGTVFNEQHVDSLAQAIGSQLLR